MYDASGRRVRRVWVRSGIIDERVYLGGYEEWRQYTGTVIPTATLDETPETVHISDDARRVCMVETLTWTGGSAVTTPTPRYQYDNHLGTACAEADTAGLVISYEEYHPYGTSSYRSFTSPNVSDKRYRYTGEERDEETKPYPLKRASAATASELRVLATSLIRGLVSTEWRANLLQSPACKHDLARSK